MLRNFPVIEIAAIDRPIEIRPFGRLLALAGIWLQRRRTRLALAELDDRLLRDVGLSRSDAIAESAMPFWQPFIRLQKK